jgi:CDP-glucose 4,6-dehydratase
MNLFNNIYKDKKVLITGDTGFKGSWLSIWLKELGAEVFGYALPAKTEMDNFVITKLNEKIKHEDGDIRDKDHFLNFFNKVQPDFAFHLAAQPLVIDSYNDPHYTFETNLMGAVNFFEAVRNTISVKTAVNITSDKCYQNNEWVWGYRENEPMGGKDPYSASKGCSELITNSYLNSFFLKQESANIASARAGNVIGGGDWAENRIVPDFFRAIKNKETLCIRYPNATRPWQHVLEPLGGYLLLASKLYSEGKTFQGGWNFGPKDQNNYSVKDLIENMIKKRGKGKYEIDKVNEKVYEAGLLKLDISKAQNKLGWNPVLNFDETVQMTVEGYTDELNGSDIYDKRKKQILDYINLAKQKNIGWAL